MKSRNDILDDQLRGIDPVKAENLDQALSNSTPSNLLQTILASGPPRSKSQRSLRRGRVRSKPMRRRIVAPMAISAVAALAIAVGLLDGVDSDHSAVSALDSVATAAAASQPPPVDLPFLYLKTQTTSIDTAIAKGRSWSVYRSQVQEEWTGKTEPGRLRIVEDPPEFVGPADRAAWVAAGSPNFLASGFDGHTVEESVPAGTSDDALGGDDISDLPTDPEALSHYLGMQAEGADNSAPLPTRTLELVADILRDPAATPELRAALYRAAERIPGIEFLGEMSDEAGRQGLAVGITSTYSGVRTLYSLIFSPETSEVLATSATALEPVDFADAEPPLVTETTIYLASGATASLSSEP